MSTYRHILRFEKYIYHNKKYRIITFEKRQFEKIKQKYRNRIGCRLIIKKDTWISKQNRNYIGKNIFLILLHI